MKGAIRLAAIMHIPSTFVFTHDSIGVGEDGPTHQPIEQLVDAARDAEPRRRAARRLQRDRARAGATRCARPTGRRRSRSRARACPSGTRRACPDDAIERGAYVLHDTDGGDPELILMATGSEVHMRQRRARSCSKRTASGYGSSRCRASTASPSRTRPTATACCRRRCARGSRSRRPARSAGTAGWATTATSSRWRASAPRRPRRSLYQHFGFTGEAVAERAPGRPGTRKGSR